MDQYFYVLEPGRSSPEGPFLESEIVRRMAAGTISTKAKLQPVGAKKAEPQLTQPAPELIHDEPIELEDVSEPEAFEPEPEPLAAPPPRAQGTIPPPIVNPVPMALVTRSAAQERPPVADHETVRFSRIEQVRRLPKKAIYAIAGGAAVILVATIAIIATRGGKVEVKNAMARVSTSMGTGTGFFIDGPDDNVYVATAYHVVDRGERVLVERDVEISDKKHYVEAYPDTEIVAADPDADLAIVRINNVAASRFDRLPLAKQPQKDQRILSYGYPGSNLVKSAGLVSKDGKILSLVMFPAWDTRYSRILRENVVDGLLVSTDIEPGFSGGPTVNEDGEVVGINVTRDRAHVGQNGAVSVTALRSLLAQVKPASACVEPKAEDVVALLKRVQSEYLLLPVEERAKVRETEFIAASDMPMLRKWINEIRREERNSDAEFSKLHISGQAALGIYFARMPGKLLETYRSPSTKAPLAACELTNQRLASFLGDLDTVDRRMGMDRGAQARVDTCDDLAVRPLAWDIAAATLQWDGREKDYTVTKLDRMDDEGRMYRASVRISGATNLIDVWIGTDGAGQARLKLFDVQDNLYAITSPRSISTSSLQGTWEMKRPRVTDAIDKDAEVESDEKLDISITDDRHVAIRHVVTQHHFIAGKKANVFSCNRSREIEVGLLQSFTGTLENGVVIALPEKDAETVGKDAGYCQSKHRPDRIIAAKLVGDQLYLYRTDGSAYPETLQFSKASGI